MKFMYYAEYKQKSEISFDEPSNIDWDGSSAIRYFRDENDLIYSYLENETDKELLGIALAKLNEREKRIMELRFGLNGSSEKTQKEVADLLGISQSYISRIEKRIINRLKKEINNMV